MTVLCSKYVSNDFAIYDDQMCLKARQRANVCSYSSQSSSSSSSFSGSAPGFCSVEGGVDGAAEDVLEAGGSIEDGEGELGFSRPCINISPPPTCSANLSPPAACWPGAPAFRSVADDCTGAAGGGDEPPAVVLPEQSASSIPIFRFAPY